MVIYCFLIVVVNLLTDLTYGVDRPAGQHERDDGTAQPRLLDATHPTT